MANIENKDKTPQEKDIKISQRLQKTKEKVQKLSWWAKLFLFCFFFFLFSIFSVLVLINTPWGQNRIAKIAIDEFVNKGFGTTFETENVEINFLGDVVISGVSAKDHHGFEFLRAEKLIGHSDWFALIFNSRDLKFQKLGLEELYLKVITYKGEDQDNFTKFIEKFDSPKDPKKPPFKMTSRIEIKDSKISIVNENSGEDGKWLKAEKFNAYVSNLQVVGPDVKLKLNRMSFITERWGKKHFLETLSGDLAITKEKFAFTDLIFNTDQSLLQGDLIFHLDKKTGWKDFNDKVKWEMKLKQGSRLHGYDISYFVKNWNNYQDYQLVGKMLGTLNNFTLNNFAIKVKNNHLQTPNIKLANLLNNRDFEIKTNDLNADITYQGLRESLPTFISEKMGNFADDFGKIKYKGLADVNPKRVIAKGNLITDIGEVDAREFVLSDYSSKMPHYQGNIVVKNLNTTAITKKDEVGLISGNFNVDGRGFDLNTLSLTTKSDITSIEIAGKTLQNIRVDGDLTAKKFDGNVKLADPFFRGDLQGKVDFSTPKLFADIRGYVEHLDLAHFGIMGGQTTFSGNVDGSISMTNVNDLVLDAKLGNTILGGDKILKIPNGAVKIAFEEGDRVIDVDIPEIIKGRVIGDFNLDNLGEMVNGAIDKIFVGNDVKKYHQNQSFRIDADVYQKLVDYFVPEVKIPNGAKVVGNFDGNTNDFVFDVDAPQLKYIITKTEEISEADRLLALQNPEYIVRENVIKDSVVVDNIALEINTKNPQEYWKARVDRAVYQGSLLKDIRIDAENIDNKLNIATRLQIGTLEKEKNNEMVDYAADIDQFVNENGDYVFQFDPTKLKISKFMWLVDTSPELNHSITYRRKDKDFVIHNLRVYSDESEVLLNGIYKTTKDFDLDGEIKNMDVAKVWAIAFQDSKVDIQGIANGDFKLKMNPTHLEPNIDLSIDNIKVNNRKIGSLIVNAAGSDMPNIYDIDAKILDKDLFRDEKLSLKGIVDNNTKSPTLDLKANLNKFDLGFVQAFVGDIFTNFRGNVSGEIGIDGKLNDINYGGDIAVNDFGLKLNFSGVDYTFDDTVVNLYNGNLIFQFVGVKDGRKQSKGEVSLGQLNLSDLTNIGANLIIRADDLQLLDTTQSDFDIFWGKIYSKGDLIVGYMDNILDINATASVLSNSIFTLNSNSTSSVDEFKMLRFVERKEGGGIRLAERKRTGVALNIDLDITADKNSTVNVLVGDEVGDISVRGETQNMKFRMDKTGNMAMNGTYFVDSGTYVSKMILEKIFQIQKGSSLQWTGDVMNPALDITANYNALVSNASEYLAVGSLPVINMQLQTQITNRLTSPKVEPNIVAFDVSSQIKDVLNTKLATEEERVLQFASILALGNFNVSNTNVSSAIGSGVNVVFKQLSSAFNSISNDFQIDLDYIKGSESANIGDRTSGSISYRFSPRFKIKTGVGVPLSNTATTQNNYLSGEGIVEYDWSETIDGSRIMRVYSKPANVGLVAGSNAGANQTYGGGVVLSYGFNRLFPKKKQKNKKKDKVKKDKVKKDKVKKDSISLLKNEKNH